MKFNTEAFRAIFKKLDNKASNLLFLLLLGVALLIFSSHYSKNNTTKIETEQENDVANSTIVATASDEMSYETKLEARLKKVLKEVEGVGNIEVMLTISYGRELVIAEDSRSESTTSTESNQSDTKQNQTESTEKKTVIISQNTNTNEPIVLKTIEPQIEGAIIVAQGGDNVLVREQLIRAAQAVLNIPSHKVEVLKMK